jgi:hypothetical protein
MLHVTCASRNFDYLPRQPARTVPVPAIHRAVEQRPSFPAAACCSGRLLGPDWRHPLHRRKRQSVGWFMRHGWYSPRFQALADWYLADPIFTQEELSFRRVPRSCFFAHQLHCLLGHHLPSSAAFDWHESAEDAQEPGGGPPADQDRTGALREAAAEHPARVRSPTVCARSDKTIADGFADVTVMFADIVNFTQVAANMSPSQVFAMLNRIFSAFDELAEEFGLEKDQDYRRCLHGRGRTQ